MSVLGNTVVCDEKHTDPKHLPAGTLRLAGHGTDSLRSRTPHWPLSTYMSTPHHGQTVPQRPPFGSDRDAAGRMVEVSGSRVPAGAGRVGGPAHGLGAHGLADQPVQLLLVRQRARRLLGAQLCELAPWRSVVFLN